MCDYQTLIATTDGSPVQTKYCQRAAQFWVQSLLSTHNSLACTHHLARIVRQIEAEARKFDLCAVNPPNTEGPDLRYLRKEYDGRISPRVTRQVNNYARVTVKPYTRKAN